jgi:hypothetical protein
MPVSSIEAAVGSKETVARRQQAAADQGMRTFQRLLAYMGEFAALYAAQFGEAPSMTLARERQQLR